MSKPKVLVLFGGDSSEREVSIRSADNVIKTLKKLGYPTVDFDTKNLIINSKKLTSEIKKMDVVLPILHGQDGEDGVVQTILEKCDAKFLGSDSKASKVCFDKKLTREVLIKHKLPVANGSEVDLEGYKKFIKKYPRYVLKPRRSGSSIDVLVVRERSTKTRTVAEALLAKYRTMMVEELISGQEVTVPILDNKALPPILILPPYGEEFDYQNKYNGKTKEICPIPAETLSRNIQDKVMDLAMRVHRVTGAQHLSRVDIMLRENGSPVVLEINTMPGMTEQSLFPKSAEVAGMSFEELVEKFVTLARRP